MNYSDLNDLRSMLQGLSTNPSDSDKIEEVDLVAKEILGKLQSKL